MARLPGSVMTSNYQMGRKHGKIWTNIEKHGDLPVLKNWHWSALLDNLNTGFYRQCTKRHGQMGTAINA